MHTTLANEDLPRAGRCPRLKRSLGTLVIGLAALALAQGASPPNEHPLGPEPPMAAPAAARRAHRSPRAAFERALLDRARAALANGDAHAALVALDEHSLWFNEGDLEAEALGLSIDAYLLGGNRSRAKEIAEILVDRHPDSTVTSIYRRFLGD